MSASAFKAKCLDVFDQVATRHVEVVITKRGHPVAKVVPFDAQPDAVFGSLKGLVIGYGDLVAAEPFPVSRTDPLDE